MPVRDGLSQLRGRFWVCIQCISDIYPIQGVQVVEMNNMVLYILDSFDDVADQARIRGDLEFLEHLRQLARS